MVSSNLLCEEFLFENSRYWYHISTTLRRKRHCLTPWDNGRGFNRNPLEPDVKRICVAPSVPHCLTAVPYSPGETFTIYRTAHKVKATYAEGVYDAPITMEGWIQASMMFVKIGTLSLPYVARTYGINIIDEAASGSDNRYSGKVLAWWNRCPLKRYIKRA